MNNADIGKIMLEIGELLEIKGDMIFKIRAYLKAAEILSTYPEDLVKLYKETGIKGLTQIPGIGEGLAKKLEELFNTGKIKYFEDLKKELPEGLLELLSVQGVGPKKAKIFFEELGIKDLKGLEKAVKSGKLKGLKGMGEKTEENILKGIEYRKKGNERMRLGDALPIAEGLIKELKAAGAKEAVFAGSLRRGKETAGDIDILVTAKEHGKAIEAFTSFERVSRVLAKGGTKASILTKDGIQADLRVLAPDEFGAALNYFTGSKDHNVLLRELAIKKGLKLSEYGVFKGEKRFASKTEEEVYRALGLPYIEPELREGRGEIEAALNGKLPRLVELGDIRGDLHMHTAASDGTGSIRELVSAAKKKGYEYIGITDHSASLKVARGLSSELLLKRIKEIETLNKNLKGLRVLCGSEVDIKPDGTLDYNDGLLSRLDYAIGSVHTSFRMKKDDMTKRVIRAFKSGRMKIFGHPTGRLLNEREPYEIDMGEVISAAAGEGVALELSASPYRLDLTDINCRAAKEKGALVSINTDSHAIGELDNMKYGVTTARRGWLEKNNVINCLSLKALLRFLAK